MPGPMSWVMVLLVVVVAFGRGGYAPWATLVLEVGAALLLLWAVADVVFVTSASERASHVELSRARRKLPFWSRHRALARSLRAVTMGRLPERPPTAEVDILPPGAMSCEGRESVSTEDIFFVAGYPFRQTHLGLPLLLLTVWIGLSILPLPSEWLGVLSPRAHELRREVENLIGSTATLAPAPWSLTPFLSLRSLWMWLAYMALFYVAANAAARSGRVRGLAWIFLAAGVGFGIYGIGQWLLGLRELLGMEPVAAGLRATGSFGNRNHYAAFMEMLLLCSLGVLGAAWTGLWSRLPKRRGVWMQRDAPSQEKRAKLYIASLGVMVTSLGLLFSLSRSGISCALIGCAALVLLAKFSVNAASPDLIDLDESGTSRSRGEAGRFPGRRLGHVYLALALAALAAAFWIGIDPVVSRFELLSEEWEAEKGRSQVWLDSLPAIKDFWLTGAGLSSFRYVFPIYRSFGGVLFYSWAHNDYLQALVELGVPGLLLTVWILVAVVKEARRTRRRLAEDRPLWVLHAGLCAAAFSMALHSLTDFSLHMPADAALLSMIVGLVVGLRTERSKHTESS